MSSKFPTFRARLKAVKTQADQMDEELWAMAEAHIAELERALRACEAYATELAEKIDAHNERA
jgi:hypothetical protein